MNICFLHSEWIEKASIDFYTIIPLRYKKLLGKSYKIHCLFAGDFDETDFDLEGISIHGLKHTFIRKGIFASILNSLLTFFHLYAYIRKYNIDIVINLMGHYYFFLPSLAAKMRKKKVIARVTGILPRNKNMLSRSQKIRRKLGDILEIISLSMPDRVIALSSSIKKDLLEHGIPEKKIIVLSQGIDTKKFTGNKLSAPYKKKTLRVLFVGRLVKNKGADICIQAFIKAKNKCQDIELIIIGDGPLKDNLKKKYEAEKGILFSGYMNHEDLPKQYNLADILVLSSFSEGLPNVVMEAMASHVPVIATNVGEIPSLLGDGRGIIVDPGDIDKISEGIIRLLSDKELRKTITKKAFDYLVENHSFYALKKSATEVFSF